MSSILDEKVSSLIQAPLLKCALKKVKNGYRITFNPLPPNAPGVYVVWDLEENKAFYFGETRNLRSRFRLLFGRSYAENPHPCHRSYTQAFKAIPNQEVFARKFAVKFIRTDGLIGRLEIEEKAQEVHKTNKKKYYELWKQVSG